MKFLDIQTASGESHTVPISTATIKIGRAPDNHVVLPDTQRNISRWHARIQFTPNAPPVLVDLKSANGTFLNGEPIAGPAPLSPNDAIRIGPHLIVYRDDSQPAAAFSIEAGKVELDRLQSRASLVDLATATSPGASGVELLEILHEVIVALARTHTVEEVKSQAALLLFKIQPVHRASVMLWDERSQTFSEGEVHVRGRSVSVAPVSNRPRDLVLSSTILEHVRQHNVPLLIRDARSDQRLSASTSVARAGIQAAFCSPLTVQGRLLGVLYADNLAAPDAFSERDFRTFTSIAAQTGLALANAQARQELSRQQVERAAMRLYLPAQILEMIAESGGSMHLGGILQPVSVLFADIRGFTGMSEQMDAREVVQMLNELFTAMSAVIFEAGGTLDKFIGDCVMALFGAPVAFEDGPARAVLCAIEMQRRAAQLNTIRAARALPPIRIGIGIHHGPAVVGNIGSADRMQYTAIGDTVNVAARLVSRAEPDQILISGELHAIVHECCGFQALGRTDLKGRAGAIETYAVLWQA